MDKGFTVVELMLAIAILGILTAIAIPQLTNMIRKSQEAVTKANLGTLRSALAIYHTDTEGRYPTDDLTSLMPYLFSPNFPKAFAVPWHEPGNTVKIGGDEAWTSDDVHWRYWNVRADANGIPHARWGQIRVNCSHTDLRGMPWTNY